MILIDTNVILRVEQENNVQYDEARNAIAVIFRNPKLRGVIVPQVMNEYWSVCTRPATSRGGFGWTTEVTAQRLSAWEKAYDVLRDQPETYEHWKSLVTKYDVKGKNAHDARLVAAMLVHSLTHILTFNIEDFKRFQEIIPIHPSQVDDKFRLT
ncbi:type II toxin-antitoxin system VapC family toxin [Lyngbya confervoides]|uniref:PIN domain-containing protein n=1 Tax=Lyngbya confervoides BDU141951 TaxID=1574623 RepID=A0ABD4T7M3_9CYAN|nr:PIN domain-containing protein [Lyngbya confervoides]MCM1984463.1 PIN domain-containing protein [Lyngbya confervoides BDU141951]